MSCPSAAHTVRRAQTELFTDVIMIPYNYKDLCFVVLCLRPEAVSELVERSVAESLRPSSSLGYRVVYGFLQCPHRRRALTLTNKKPNLHHSA